MKTKEIVLVSMMAALTAILAQLSIPIGAVPFTLSIFGAYFAAGLLGSKLGTLSMAVYLLIGAVGMPVFANFRGGIQVLIGPTGGYLVGYLIATYLIGKLFEKVEGPYHISYTRFVVVSFIGLIVIYIFGVVQLKYVLDFTWSNAYASGIAPFILFDIVKIAIAGSIVLPVRRALINANLIN